MFTHAGLVLEGLEIQDLIESHDIGSNIMMVTSR